MPEKNDLPVLKLLLHCSLIVGICVGGSMCGCKRKGCMWWEESENFYGYLKLHMIANLYSSWFCCCLFVCLWVWGFCFVFVRLVLCHGLGDSSPWLTCHTNCVCSNEVHVVVQNCSLWPGYKRKEGMNKFQQSCYRACPSDTRTSSSSHRLMVSPIPVVIPQAKYQGPLGDLPVQL